MQVSYPKDKVVALPTEKPSVYQSLNSVDATTHTLWAQYYRFLPLKVVVRVLANISLKGTVKYADFVAVVLQTAATSGDWLRTLDSRRGRGEKLSSGFPERDKASLERFQQQYIANYRPGQRTIGFPVELGLLTLIEREGDLIVGLTKAGAIFSLERNPILDDQRTDVTLSPNERFFLVEHIRRNLPKEFEIMQGILESVSKGLDTPEKLDAVCRNLYGEDSLDWSAGHLTSMRAGVVSRASELGLLIREWSGRNVKYVPTVEGFAILSGEYSRISDAYKTMIQSMEVVS